MILRGVIVRRRPQNEFDGVRIQSKIQPLIEAPDIIINLDNSANSIQLPWFGQRADARGVVKGWTNETDSQDLIRYMWDDGAVKEIADTEVLAEVNQARLAACHCTSDRFYRWNGWTNETSLVF